MSAAEPDPTDDHIFAAVIAEGAGRLLRELRAKDSGADPTALRAAGDEKAQAFIAARLALALPADSVLSEEAADDPSRLSARRLWIIDPLYGTREYGEPGRTDWAVHVALWQDGALVAGAVALPALELVLGTAGGPALPPAADPPRLVVSRTRAPALVTGVADRLGALTVAMGSAGAKAMAVVRGEAEAYLHAGGMYEWDSAAPVAVAAAAGLHTSRIDGTALSYNNASPYLPDLLICRPELAAILLDAIAGLR
ncbi:3'(2'),5'-bisphosphate nucleotidase CysQ [soil metagenome]